jgi:hypothetical protein
MKTKALGVIAALVGVVSVVLLVVAAPAGAVNYPPTTVAGDGAAVSAAAASQGQQALPFTGGDSMRLVWIAVALVAMGALLVAWKRRSTAVQ